MLRRRPLFHRPRCIAIAACAASAIKISRAGNLPPPSGLPGSRAAFQISPRFIFVKHANTVSTSFIRSSDSLDKIR
jgi:hypothetical protein